MSPRGQPRPEESDTIAKPLPIEYVAEMISDPCGGLLYQGHFEYCNRTDDLSEGIKKCWKPEGCSLHIYSETEFQQCLENIYQGDKEVILIGDSRMGYISKFIISLAFKSDMFDIDFMDRTNLRHEPTNTTFRFFRKDYLDNKVLNLLKRIRSSSTRTLMLVIGITLHEVKNHGTGNGLTNFKSKLKKAKEHLDAIGKKTIVMWMIQPPVREDLLVVEGRNQVNNYGVDLYNEAAQKILTGGSVRLWHSARRIGEDSMYFYWDRAHISKFANHNDKQILINALCNTHMNLPSGACCI